jgi:endonuclease/exonuclease/phosphatase family metal-dependent hydrolase
MFWNVENFFDWRNDSTTVSDAEFSSRGERRWTWKRFQAKANAFAKALFWIEGDTGRLPDIIGLEEVENAFVLRQLLQKTALRKLDYKYVHYDSPDRRGIDVALLYRSSRLELLDSKPCHLFSSDTLMATRDILLCVFKGKPSVIPGLTGNPTSASHDVIPGLTGNLLEEDRCPIGVGHDDGSVGYYGRSAGHDDSSTGYSGAFAVLVNHHPSKYGGAAESEPRRRIAVERLRFLVDSLAAVGIDHVIAGGDFNDTPDNPVFRLLEPALIPMHMDLFRRGLGTIKYDGKWDLIDHIYVSPILVATTAPVLARMRILRIPFLLARDTAHSGEKPLRTFQGPRILGGVSDHLPILLEVALPMDKKGGSTPGKGSFIPSERISPLVKGSPAPGEPP